MQRLKRQLNRFFFTSRFSNWLWETSVSHSWRCIRLSGMLLISVILTIRSYRLYLRHATVVALLLLAGIFWDTSKSLSLAAIAWLLRSAVLLAQQPEENEGHRAGGKGFNSRLCENSLEAVADLIQRDLDGSLAPGKLAYVEFDETKDGELVVLHDLQRVVRASRGGPINSAVMAQLAEEAGDLDRARVQDVKWSTLQGLHLGCHEGVHIPSLAAFLQCCKSSGLRRSMAVEVKSIFTDAGRKTFLQLLRQYKEEHCRTLQRQHAGLEYKQFGFLAAISFPFNWAASFGEFGSREWHVWGRNFQEADIPVRSCVAHFIDMIDGA